MTMSRGELYKEAKALGWTTKWNQSKKADLQKYIDDRPNQKRKYHVKSLRSRLYKEAQAIGWPNIWNYSTINDLKKYIAYRPLACKIEQEIIDIVPKDIIRMIVDYASIIPTHKNSYHIYTIECDRRIRINDFVEHNRGDLCKIIGETEYDWICRVYEPAYIQEEDDGKWAWTYKFYNMEYVKPHVKDGEFCDKRVRKADRCLERPISNKARCFYIAHINN